MWSKFKTTNLDVSIFVIFKQAASETGESARSVSVPLFKDFKMRTFLSNKERNILRKQIT